MNITEMTIGQLEESLIKVCQISEIKGLAWATAKSLYESLEDKKKVILADNSPLIGTESHKEREAYKSTPFKEYLEGLAVARENSNKAWVEYSSSKDKFEALRSILSNRREEMKRGI